MTFFAPGRVPRRRLRSLHRRMSFRAFERLPQRLGWKHQYFEGRAHITPVPLRVTFLYPLAPGDFPKALTFRPVVPKDNSALLGPFLNAFSRAPEYADDSQDLFRRKATQYIHSYFGTVRGEPSPVSVLAEANGRIQGAALVKHRRSGPLLDCLFVVPEYARQGLATALVNQVVQSLCRRGEKRLLSYAMLANGPSVAWHKNFGFQELPDLHLARHCHWVYHHEHERRRRLGRASREELDYLAAKTAYWRGEVERLQVREKEDFWAVHPFFD